MTLPTPAELRAALPVGTTGLRVAFSGGVDSTVLLHIACQTGLPVTAVHVHHGLSVHADAWAARCEAFCDRLGVACETVPVVPEVERDGLQAGARAARYAALAERLGQGEALLTGHHADDQAETVLARMLRGTGPDGLTGIPACRGLGTGWLVRPLLQARRREIEAYARVQGLSWIDDPRNANPADQRARIRHSLLPTLEQEAPDVRDALRRLASEAAEAQTVRSWLLAAYCQAHGLSLEGALPVEILTPMPTAVRLAMLRDWIAQGGQRPPGRRRLENGLAMLLNAGPDRQPALQWPEGQVRRFANRLYRLPPRLPSPPSPVSIQPAEIGAGRESPWGDSGHILWQPAQGPLGLDTRRMGEPLQVRAARPGERFRLPGRRRRALREWLREAGVPGWWRARWPVITDAGDELLAVPDIGISATAAARPGVAALRPRWVPAGLHSGADWPLTRALSSD